MGTESQILGCSVDQLGEMCQQVKREAEEENVRRAGARVEWERPYVLLVELFVTDIVLLADKDGDAYEI
jgi:hypothetical protein